MGRERSTDGADTLPGGDPMSSVGEYGTYSGELGAGVGTTITSHQDGVFGI